MRHLILAAAATLAAACVTLDRPAQSQFIPDSGQQSPRTFRYILVADTHYTDQEHEGWLAQTIAENRYCPRGHEITHREIVRTELLLGSQSKKHWSGRCLP